LKLKPTYNIRGSRYFQAMICDTSLNVSVMAMDHKGPKNNGVHSKKFPVKRSASLIFRELYRSNDLPNFRCNIGGRQKLPVGQYGIKQVKVSKN
jgi:hypothetical protein